MHNIETPTMTFHGLVLMGLDMHLARCGLDDDEFAADLVARGIQYSGDDIRRFRVEGFPSTWFDHTAYRLGLTGTEAVAYMLQVSPPPHRSCPSCTCGIPARDRLAIARALLVDGESGADVALKEYRRAHGQHRETCAP